MSTPTNFQIDSFDESTGIERFLDRHFKKLALLLVLLIVIGSAIFLRSSVKAATLQEAGQALSEAKTLEQLDGVRTKYAGTPAAFAATLQHAVLLAKNGKADLAEKDLRAALAESPKHPAANNARLLLATLVQGKNPAEAKQLFNDIAAQGSTSHLAPYAMSQVAAIVLREGDAKQAEKLWSDASSQFSENSLSRVAQYESMILKADAPAEIDVAEKPAATLGAPNQVAPLGKP